MRGRRLLVVVALALSAAACANTRPGAAALEADNPLRAIAPPPFGMEDFFASSPETPAPQRVRLGRWLFYDQRLSADERVSCATCHRPEYAFSEPTAVSTGVAGQRGRRKAPSLLNLASRTVLVDVPIGEREQTFFWDGRVTGLAAQVVQPIADPREMGLAHEAAVARLASISGYRPYFEAAFGSNAVTLERVAAALADYVRLRRSGDSAYDRWAYGRDGRGLSDAAKRGSDLFFFKARCATCHAGFNFSDGRFHNLGVGWNASQQTFADEGRSAVTHAARDRGRFKTPGLRDVSRHAPYMHDGSLATLRDVVAFYNRGGIANPERSARIAPLGLGDGEMAAIVAFLESLDGSGYADQPPRVFPQ